MNRVLVIASHMDDEVLGTGATISKHKKAGDEVSVIFVANRVYNHVYDKGKNEMEKTHALKAKEVLGYDKAVFLGLPDERLDMAVLDMIIPLEKHIYKLKPDTVYIPFRGDNNQDHRAVFDASRVVLRPAATPFVRNIYMYEVPSSTEQSPPLLESAFMPNYYVDIKGFIDKKLKAFRSYKSEKRTYPNPRSEEAMRILAKKRGIEIGFHYAEAFMMLRGKWEQE